jgi:hypothetical protein
MEFKCFLEMASFTLPHPIVIDGEYVTAVDMQFEKYPRTINDSGKVMNQGSKFVAKIPNSSDYIVYDGAGNSNFINKNDIIEYITKGFNKISGDWWKKAFFIKD